MVTVGGAGRGGGVQGVGWEGVLVVTVLRVWLPLRRRRQLSLLGSCMSGRPLQTLSWRRTCKNISIAKCLSKKEG